MTTHLLNDCLRNSWRSMNMIIKTLTAIYYQLSYHLIYFFSYRKATDHVCRHAHATIIDIGLRWVNNVQCAFIGSLFASVVMDDKSNFTYLQRALASLPKTFLWYNLKKKFRNFPWNFNFLSISLFKTQAEHF